MVQSALYEHRFWLQILGDHSRFILNALSPKETPAIQKAQYFIQAFDHLLELSRGIKSETEAATINEQAYSVTIELRKFKLDILERLLLGQITIGFTPTFINHMVNELEEYLRILTDLLAGKPVPLFDPLHHDLLWLPDAAGHAAAIAMDLDAVEKRLLQKSVKFEAHFQQLYMKSIEMAGYMRTKLRNFPAFKRFHHEIELEMALFISFLRELEEMELTAEVLDRISPLIPDHMMREECYYLTKLALHGMVSDPDCNPAKPRIEA
ncbi:DUF2935 domain-containing protein [Paenibacillus beijingensis]|uniref:DUF2935 domain-containing protein n=1 Tax=Paenibacillus beijingensis TaxID=1126833 RepID=A0A0D5NNM0_9BACL|nr:DUF2935 domain-containing protein [Paenibacillus beijingensis]AJY76871.1 hypothetical protein VN24_22805 [Paenibacillus beijingensis]